MLLEHETYEEQKSKYLIQALSNINVNINRCIKIKKPLSPYFQNLKC